MAQAMAQAMAQDGRRDFVKYSFFKVDLEWRRLSPGERARSKTEFADMVAEFSDRVTMASYSLAGTRGDVDFMLWKISPALEPITDLLGQLRHTKLGQFLQMPHSYLAMTRRSPYVDSHRHRGRRALPPPCAFWAASTCFSIPLSRPTTGISCNRRRGSG